MKRYTVEGLRELLGSGSSKRRTRGARRRESLPEDRLAFELEHLKVRGWIREHRFDPPRGWRFDFAWPDLRVAVEVHGAVHAQGRHTRGTGFRADREKMNRAALLGWLVLEVTPEHVSRGQAVAWALEALRLRGGSGAV